MTTVTTEQVFKDSFGLNTTDANAYFDFAIDGDLMATASGVIGIQLFDISDPENITRYGTPTGVNFWSHRSVLFLDGDLYCCRRQGFGEAADGAGAIDRYDVSVPETPVLVDTYSRQGPGDSDWARFSYIATDGIHIYAAGQRQGLYKFLALDLDAGPVPGGVILAGDPVDIESQGVSYSNGYVYFDNYGILGEGMRILDADTFGTITDISVPVYVSGGDQLKPWHSKAVGNKLYVSSLLIDTSLLTKGLLVLDITDPASITDWFAFEDHPPWALGVWSNAGDQPNTGLTVKDDICYIANGNSGFLVYDVSDPENPEFVTQVGTLASPDTTHGVITTTKNGKDYLIYGDGQQTSGVASSRSLYVEKITVRNMGFVLGDNTPTGDGSVFINLTSARTTGMLLGQPHLAGPGDFLHTIGCVFLEQSAQRDYNIRLYELNTGIVEPEDIVAGFPTDVNFIVPGSPETDGDEFTPTPLVISDFALTEGITYVLAGFMTSGSGSGELATLTESGQQSSQDNVTSPGVAPAVWTQDGTAFNKSTLLYALGDTITVAPTLTTHSSTMGLLVNAGNTGGVSLFTYANPNIATAQVTAADFWSTPKFPLNPLDVIWCQLSDGFVKLSMTTATTAEAV